MTNKKELYNIEIRNQMFKHVGEYIHLKTNDKVWKI